MRPDLSKVMRREMLHSDHAARCWLDAKRKDARKRPAQPSPAQPSPAERGPLMRDEHDHATAELPTIPPLPIKPRRITLAEYRARSGFQSPRNRDRCHTCKHAQGVEMGDGETKAFCGIGNGYVGQGAWCREFAQ